MSSMDRRKPWCLCFLPLVVALGATAADPPPVEVVAVVLDSAGQPAQGVEVCCVRRGYPAFRTTPLGDDERAVSDAEGRVTFHLAPGHNQCILRAARGEQAANHWFTARDIRQGEPFVLRLATGTRVSGVVRDEAGKPLQDVVVPVSYTHLTLPTN